MLALVFFGFNSTVFIWRWFKTFLWLHFNKFLWPRFNRFLLWPCFNRFLWLRFIRCNSKKLRFVLRKDLQRECQYRNYADAKCDSQYLSQQIFQKIEKTAWHGGTVILDLSVLLAVSLSLWLNFWSLRRICHTPYWCTGRNGDWQSDITWGLSS